MLALLVGEVSYQEYKPDLRQADQQWLVVHPVFPSKFPVFITQNPVETHQLVLDLFVSENSVEASLLGRFVPLAPCVSPSRRPQRP
jgi:hypothetical protein